MKKFECTWVLLFVVLAFGCGKERDSNNSDPVTADVAVASPTPQTTVEELTSEAQTPVAPAEPEPQLPAPPTFDQATYLARQEVAMLAFVEKLKAIRVYDSPPAFLQPTVGQSKVGIHYGSPSRALNQIIKAISPSHPQTIRDAAACPLELFITKLSLFGKSGRCPAASH